MFVLAKNKSDWQLLRANCQVIQNNAGSTRKVDIMKGQTLLLALVIGMSLLGTREAVCKKPPQSPMSRPKLDRSSALRNSDNFRSSQWDSITFTLSQEEHPRFILREAYLKIMLMTQSSCLTSLGKIHADINMLFNLPPMPLTGVG